MRPATESCGAAWSRDSVWDAHGCGWPSTARPYRVPRPQWGKRPLAGLIVLAVTELADLRVIPMTAVYAAFLYPAESEEQNRL